MKAMQKHCDPQSKELLDSALRKNGRRTLLRGYKTM